MFRGSKLMPLIRRSSISVEALQDQSNKTRQLAPEISLQVLDKRHNLNQIRSLLARGFVVNNEPIVHVLGELYYPSLPSNVRVPLMEERFKGLFSDESMIRKVGQGLSVVAVRDNDPEKLVSVMFAEKYTGGIYKGESIIADPLCQTGLNLMRAVHEKAEPILKEYATTRSVIFVSHTATHPKYRALGVFENLSDMLFRLQVVEQNAAVCCLMTSHRLANFIIQRYGFQVITEVLYKDYEENGHNVFGQLSQQEVSAKALLAYQ